MIEDADWFAEKEEVCVRRGEEEEDRWIKVKTVKFFELKFISTRDLGKINKRNFKYSGPSWIILFFTKHCPLDISMSVPLLSDT